MIFYNCIKPLVPGIAVGLISMYNHRPLFCQNSQYSAFNFPSRRNLMTQLKQQEFDILVIGGGASGCGVAMAASSRGYKVALVERNDFGSGTSCKSTKLVHGGVRYLQKAVTHLDWQEFKLVTESLNERTILLSSCPNMVTPVPIMLPCSGLIDFMYKYSGLLLYHIIVRDDRMKPRRISKNEIQDTFPFLDMSNIYNGIVYYDGQFNDSRMVITAIKTAITKGSVACNYVNLESLNMVGGECKSATVRDTLTGEIFEVKAKYIVNATGPYTDAIRNQIETGCNPIVRPSSGIHLSLPSELTRKNMGILINEPNNRVLFMLPWEGTTIVGTSDEPTKIDEKPRPLKHDAESVLRRLSTIIEDKSVVSSDKIRSCWAGIRPLVVDPKAKNDKTSNISRTHMIDVNNNILTISGGKWTIFRIMGEDTVKAIEEKNKKKFKYSKSIELYGSTNLEESYSTNLSKKYNIDSDITNHLCHQYGYCADDIIKFSTDNTLKRLHPSYSFTEEEVKYICKNEYVTSLEDILSRRMRISFIDTEVASAVAARVSQIAAEELQWDDKHRKAELNKFNKFLNEEMGRGMLNDK